MRCNPKQMIYIESRNCDEVRAMHEFSSVETMMGNWNGRDSRMGDNEILLVKRGNSVLYSSLGRKAETYDDVLRTSELMDWFA